MVDVAVIVGPTAAGKSELAVELAARVGGEVVSADAFAVYRGLDIGTAKPDAAARTRVRHHLIDIADPHDTYSAGMFMRDAAAAIEDIRARGRLPVVVGGTLFYVRSMLRGLFPEPEKSPRLRRYLRLLWKRDPGAARQWLELHDPRAAVRIAARDEQRVLRALEVAVSSGRSMTDLWEATERGRDRYRTVLMGVAVERSILHARIASRVVRMFESGLLDEVRGLLAGGVPAEAHALKAIGYRECCGVVHGTMTMEEARERTIVATRQLAKRQMTWLRSEAGMQWLHGSGKTALAQAISSVEAWRGSGTGQA